MLLFTEQKLSFVLVPTIFFQCLFMFSCIQMFTETRWACLEGCQGIELRGIPILGQICSFDGKKLSKDWWNFAILGDFFGGRGELRFPILWYDLKFLSARIVGDILETHWNRVSDLNDEKNQTLSRIVWP